MKNLIIILVAIFALAIAMPSHAELDMEDGPTYSTSGVTLVIDGWVAVSGTSPAQPVVGATVTCETCFPPISDTTDSNGYYRITYHSYCGSKSFSVQKTGYTTENGSIRDNSCPECNDCEPGSQFYPQCLDWYTCKTGIRKIWYLTPGGSTDTDSDGIWDSQDNCYQVPNGYQLGTFTRGKRGSLCQGHSDCGCDGYCSKWQEDCDADGIGNACDECVVTPGGCKSGPCPQFESLTAITPAHKLMGPMATRYLTSSDLQTFWFLVANLWWTGHNATSYKNGLHFIRGIFDGPDYLCGECVKDFDGNGVCDVEEGGYPWTVTREEQLEALQDAFARCQEQFDLCRNDPEYREENPWKCIW